MTEFYRTFAKVYDQIMDQSLYDEWLAFSLRHFSSDTRSILELACGSGELSLRMSQAGYKVTGLDISQEMLSLAREKLPEATFVMGDMRKLRFKQQFDAVTCYSDSLCYLADLDELAQVFEGVYKALKPRGIFIFDVHSTHQVDEIFPAYSYHENEEDFAFLWDSYAGGQAHTVEHQLSFFIKQADGRFTRKDELHVERTYPVSSYLAKLSAFAAVEVFADFTDQSPEPESARWFFVCKK